MGLQLNGLTAAAFFFAVYPLDLVWFILKTIYNIYMLDIIFQSIGVIANF